VKNIINNLLEKPWVNKKPRLVMAGLVEKYYSKSIAI